MAAGSRTPVADATEVAGIESPRRSRLVDDEGLKQLGPDRDQLAATPLNDALADLTDKVERHNFVIGDLIERLRPVCREADTVPTAPGEVRTVQPVNGASAIVMRLHGQAEALAEATVRLENLLRRLDV